jgi:twitching motility protein PilI
MALPREDLKFFQARLAERLRVAREQSAAASWLAVATRGLTCLFPLHQANEVLPSVSIIPVPYAKSWFVGAINSRGRMYGVVDFFSYLAHENKQKLPITERASVPSDYSLIALNVELNLNCMLMVDKVLGLRTLENFEHSANPDLHAPDYFGQLHLDAAGAAWQEIDLQKLSRSPEFFSINV